MFYHPPSRPQMPDYSITTTSSRRRQPAATAAAAATSTAAAAVATAATAAAIATRRLPPPPAAAATGCPPRRARDAIRLEPQFFFIFIYFLLLHVRNDSHRQQPSPRFAWWGGFFIAFLFFIFYPFSFNIYRLRVTSSLPTFRVVRGFFFYIVLTDYVHGTTTALRFARWVVFFITFFFL